MAGEWKVRAVEAGWKKRTVGGSGEAGQGCKAGNLGFDLRVLGSRGSA